MCSEISLPYHVVDDKGVRDEQESYSLMLRIMKLIKIQDKTVDVQYCPF